MQLEKQYQDNLDEWIEVTKTIYDEMMEDGVEDGTEIDMTYAFSSPTKEPLDLLSKDLKEKLAYEVAIDFLPEDGDEPAIYVLYGQTGAIKNYLDSLNELLTTMLTLGAGYGAKFEYWEAKLANSDSFDFGVGSFDTGGDDIETKFPLLLHLKVSQELDPVERYEKFEEPIDDLLEKQDLGFVIRSGSLCHLDSNGLEINGFELVIRIADETKAILELSRLLETLTEKNRFELQMIEEDIL